MRTLIALLLVLLSVNGFAATKKTVTMPKPSAVLTSNNTAYLSENNLWVKGDTMTSYIDRIGTRTPVGNLSPELGWKKPSIISRAGKLIRGGIAGVIATAAVDWAIDQIPDADWDGYKLTKKGDKVMSETLELYWCNQPKSGSCYSPDPAENGTNSSQFKRPNLASWKSRADYIYGQVNGNRTNYYADSTLVLATETTAKYTYSIMRKDGSKFGGPYGPFTIYRYGSCSADSLYDGSSGACYKTNTSNPFTEADYAELETKLDQVVDPNWLRDLLKASCTGSNNPAACYDSLAAESKKLTGPATVNGPTTKTTGYATNADGTTSKTETTTSTKYKLGYGDDYFTYSPSTTTTTEVDGQPVATETTEEDPETTQEEGSEEEEEDKSSISGMGCEAAVSCSGDAIQCAIASTDKDTYCLLDKFAAVKDSELKDQVSSDLGGADTKPFEGSEIGKSDLSSLIDTSSTISASCPTFPVLTFSVRGHAGSFDFSEWVAHLCQYASWYGAFLVIFAMRGGVEVIARGFG